MSIDVGTDATTAACFAGLAVSFRAGFATAEGFGAEIVLFDVALLGDFLAGFLAAVFLAVGFAVAFFVFLAAFFAAFFAVFLAVFLTALRADFLAFFPAFFTTRLPRFFAAAALLALLREALRAFFVVGLLEAFLLGVATTNSFIAQTGLPEVIAHGTLIALLPQASRTPRKPVAFAQDCMIRCRARRG